MSTMGYFEYWSATDEWVTETAWQSETVTRLRKRVIQEFREGRFDRDFETKLADRRIPLQVVLNTISSKQTYIAKYHDRYDGTRRIGFWHPRIQVFVAWKPGRNSHFKTAFDRRTGLDYMRGLLDCKLIYRPKERER